MTVGRMLTCKKASKIVTGLSKITKKFLLYFLLSEKIPKLFWVQER